MNKAGLAILGFAKKAGKLSLGMDASVQSIKSGKSKLVFVCSDISEKSRKEISFFCEKNSTPMVLSQFSIDDIGGAIGKKVGILSVNSKDFADGIISKVHEGGIADDGKI